MARRRQHEADTASTDEAPIESAAVVDEPINTDEAKRPTDKVVYIWSEGENLQPVKARDPRARTISVRGVSYEHTHETADGAWIYRAMK